MNLLVISYELRQQGRDYQAFHAALLACGPAMRPLETTSIVGTQMAAAEVRNALMSHLDAGDRLLIVTCASNAEKYELVSTGPSGERVSKMIGAAALM